MHPNEDVLNELVDGTLKPVERTGVERHLATCAECQALVDDLRGLRHAIASLELREPPAGVWPRIERVLHSEPGSHARGFQPDDRRSDTVFTRVKGSPFFWASATAAAVLVLAASLTLRMAVGSRVRGPEAETPPTATTTDTAQAVEAELRQASEHYERAIKGLEQIANADQGTLDPQTAATLRKNLAVIDQAISESRAALNTQPSSEPAQQSLIDSFKTKIALLQDTVALINEMRKGNEAGAARIVSGIKQKG
jgi:anti-sigma factor ChrR (cupin superfamily)